MKLKVVLVLSLSFILSACSQKGPICSDNWRVTGYYTPIEGDYKSPDFYAVSVNKAGRISFNRAFVKDVMLEGWGKTRFGWYLGYYNNQWYRSDDPLNSKGTPLTIGTIATDAGLVEPNSVVNIPEVEKILKVPQFVAQDVGQAIKNKKIDVYTGEGKQAKELTLRITGNHSICIRTQNNVSVKEISR
ncbi:MAG: 3D domain-containing protein [Kangiellaceae bacterium]|nr:3D domain-containing protein [Kangiellaceae bacterium]MCW8998315.1 3D domain-containing protein [Kangiellaceae bacterium]MCW9017670.1 3D domain-containing protein [Kangiellaceae bacterium]